jgi:ankyrin repeat protein
MVYWHLDTTPELQPELEPDERYGSAVESGFHAGQRHSELHVQKRGNALHDACVYQRWDELGDLVAEALQARGTDEEEPLALTQQDGDGYVPLHWAAMLNAPRKVLQLLVEAAPSTVAAKSNRSETPIDISARYAASTAMSFFRTSDLVASHIDWKTDEMNQSGAQDTVELTTNSVLHGACGCLPGRLPDWNEAIAVSGRQPELLTKPSTGGSLPLHGAARHNAPLDVLQVLFIAAPSAILVKNIYGHTPVDEIRMSRDTYHCVDITNRAKATSYLMKCSAAVQALVDATTQHSWIRFEAFFLELCAAHENMAVWPKALREGATDGGSDPLFELKQQLRSIRELATRLNSHDLELLSNMCKSLGQQSPFNSSLLVVHCAGSVITSENTADYPHREYSFEISLEGDILQSFTVRYSKAKQTHSELEDAGLTPSVAFPSHWSDAVRDFLLDEENWTARAQELEQYYQCLFTTSAVSQPAFKAIMGFGLADMEAHHKRSSARPIDDVQLIDLAMLFLHVAGEILCGREPLGNVNLDAAGDDTRRAPLRAQQLVDVLVAFVRHGPD